MPHQPEPSGANWRRLVLERAAAVGARLPDATIDELAAHLDDLHAAAREAGATDEEARRRAMAALEESPLGGLDRPPSRQPGYARARAADAAALASRNRSLSMSSALRLALRQFRMHRAFALVTVLVLGLGTGAATTVFTIVDSVVLRPLPYAAPDRLVTLWDTNVEKGLARDPISPVNFMDYRALPVFSQAAAWWRPGVNLTTPGLDPVRVNTIEVSANLFELLGVSPQVGPGFPRGGPLFVQNDRIAVISDRLWRSRFNADPGVVGQPLSMNGASFRVAGVMPPRFHFPDDVDVWQRLHWDLALHSRSAHFMESVVRLADGVTLDQAQSASNALAVRLQGQFPNSNKGWSTRLAPLLDDQLGYYRPALLVLFGAVGLLVAIGCLNVASLLLTRALSREREMSVRVALGAAPRQLVAQLVAESFVLSVAGVALGLAVAAVALPLVVSLTPVAIPRLENARVDLRALGLGSAVVAVTTLFFGLVPALVLVRRQLAGSLTSGERVSSPGTRRLYSVLVAGEIALACTMLVGSALLVRTVSRMTQTPTGVAGDDVLVATVQLTGQTYSSWRVIADAHARIVEAIREQPGVSRAGATNALPLEVAWRMPFAILGDPPPARPEDAPQAQFQSVSEDYFETFGARLAAGRAFAASDTPDAVPVVMVNRTFGQRFLGGQAVGRIITTHVGGVGPLGRNLMRPLLPPPPAGQAPAPHAPTRYEVIGVVEDVRNAPLGQALEPAVYFPTRQFPFRELVLAVRGRDTVTALAAVRAALATAAPGVPMSRAETWGERFRSRTAQSRLLMTILVVFAALAGLLAALGVYGLVSWSVALRRRELAIRLTLGAQPASIGRLVVGQGLLLVGAGVVVGIALVRLAEGVLSRVLYEVSPGDAASTTVAVVLLLASALAACALPARRAMKVDPVQGLRAE
jgi:putative ABC transport system permease protein